MVKEKQTIVTIDGQQFFTADWVMAQFSKQMFSIDRAIQMSGMALTLSIVAVIISVATAIIALQ